MTSSDRERASAVRLSGEAERPVVELPDGSRVEVIAWRPPHLLVRVGEKQRKLFVARAPGGAWIGERGQTRKVERPSRRRAAAAHAPPPGHDDLSSPMPGTVLEVLVAEGDHVAAGQRLLVLEAMKMESPLRAPRASRVTRLHAVVGATVSAGDVLVELDQEEE